MYVLMVVPSDFPNGDAGAVRDMAFAKIYQKLGYDVILIGMGKKSQMGVVDGVRYLSLYKEKNSIIAHIAQYVTYKKRLKSKVDITIKKSGIPAVIHINDISSEAINWLIQYSEKYNIPILHDSTEWYSECEFRKGKLDKAYILKDRLNQKIIQNPIKVIAISNYLKNHFEKRGIKAMRIPVIMDVKNTEKSVKNVDDKIRLIYAGNPAAKDYLKEIMVAILKLTQSDQKRLSVHILGVDEEKLKELCVVNKLPECVKVYGRVSREKVIEVMKRMDFSLLLRPSKERYAKAGFPTKSVEAMSHRVAMMCNETSDLGLYLRDCQNALIINDCTAEAFYSTIKRAINLNRNEIEKIKDNARILAEKEFDYRIFVESMRQFIESKN